MGQRLRSRAAMKLDQRKAIEPEIARCDGVLAGEDDGRPPADGVERMGQRRELDRFGPRADDQLYLCRMQPSP